MGQNKNASIICSLIHYAFNKQISRILERFLELINTLKNQPTSMEFTNLIESTKNAQNPVQKFFQNLYLIDQKNEIAGKILFDICKIKGWLDDSQISYNNIAKYFQMRISFLTCNEIYGIKFKDSIDLIVDPTKKFYYLIPELIIKNLEQISCPQCKSKNEFIQLMCEHKQCYKCLLKKLDPLKCCGKLNIKQYLLNQIKKLECLKEQNEKQKILQKYYESSNQSFGHTEQQLQQNRSVRNQLNQDNDKLKNSSVIDILYECNLCFKKVYTQLFTLQDCKHKFCYDCMFRIKLQNKDCPIQNCFKKIEQNEEVQTCQIKNNSDNKEQKIINQNLKQSIQNQSILKVTEQCWKCYKTFNYKLFEIKKCNHKICLQCLSSIEMTYESIYCFYYKCQSTFTKHEYNMYIKNLQSIQNTEPPQMQKIIINQNQSYFNCENCQNKRSEDQKYVLNCGHSICFTCITQDVQYKTSCCYLTSLDFDYQQFRKNLIINCQGCQCPFPIKNLFQLRCKHLFCLNCCSKIYLGKPQRCLEKKCERLIFDIDDLFNFIYNKKLEQSTEISNQEEQKKNSNSKEDQEENKNEQKLDKKDNNQMKEQRKFQETNIHKFSYRQNNNNKEEEQSFQVQKSVINLKEYKIDEQKKEDINIQSIKQQEIITPKQQISSQNDEQTRQDIQNFLDDSSDFENNFEEEIIIYQQIEQIKSAQEKENEYCKGNCTNCNQEFSSFNRKQLINCKSHQIGVCCILIKFENCPQCEQTLPKKVSIKQKLILPTNPVEEEYMFESTIIKPQSANYYPISHQQTYQGYSEQLQKLERQRNNQNCAIKRNVTTDTVNKRVLENQQAFDDKYKFRNEFVQHNELALLKSSPTPYVQQSYYPYRYDRVNYGGYDHRNRLELHSRDFHLNSKITTGYSGRLS
ncbi:unnamed protein product [Paramecium pentaurelia]|uniref:RING-type domain-containing protein n=1 Tax=Paramecium pentaurelia TaxID=43138 RepID=A0A8S1WR79_9CILI|nr:unnamed protein product [Paramecium pentaurelia]